MTDHAQIEEVAADWVARHDRGPLSDADRAAFSEWLEASVAHRVSFLRLEATWTRTQRLKALEHRESLHTGLTAHQRASRITYRSRTLVAAAAVLVVACFGGWSAWQQYATPVYRTEVGALRTVSLADGSRIILNTNSAIRTALSSRERAVDLQAGEAYFEISHDSVRPFRVRSGSVEVEVVGTRFAVRRTDRNVRVLVSEGRVRVRALAAGDQDVHATELGAGDVALLSGSGIELRQASQPELEDALSWRTGMVVFRDTPLLQAVSEFNRYTPRRIVIVDPQLATLRIGGTFRTANAEGFLRLLEQAFEIEATDRGDVVVLTRR